MSAKRVSRYLEKAGYLVRDTCLQLGQRVRHQKFGEGVVLNYEGEDKEARVQVDFNEEGSKWLMVAYGNLQAL